MKIIDFVKIISPSITKDALLLAFCPQDFRCKGDCEYENGTQEQCEKCWNKELEV